MAGFSLFSFGSSRPYKDVEASRLRELIMDHRQQLRTLGPSRQVPTSQLFSAFFMFPVIQPSPRTAIEKRIADMETELVLRGTRTYKPAAKPGNGVV